MAGNKAIYDTAMKRAHEYAWQNQWDRALKEYTRALAEVPDDPTAQRNMAQCYFRLKQWTQALTAYQALLQIDAEDLFAINRLAEIHLALGQHETAVETYMSLADLHVRKNQLHEAIRALRDLSRALPKDKAVHTRILELTQEVGDKQAQLAEHLALSKIALDTRSYTEAQQHADTAASLDPDNPEVKRWNYSVRRRIAEMAGTYELPGESQSTAISAMIGSGLLSTAEQEPPEAAAIIERANEAQERGDFRVALDLYDQAVRAGARRSSVFYSAGLLNQQLGRPGAGIPFLERAAQDPEFATSANYVLGQCYFAMYDYTRAVAAFERALRMVDISQLTRNEADELIELYAATAEAHIADNNAGRAASLYNNLVTIFRDRRWSHPKLAELEKQAEELYGANIQKKLLDISKGSGLLHEVVRDDPTSLIGTSSMGTSSMGTSSMGTSSMGTSSMGTSSMGTSLMPPGPQFGAEADTSTSWASDATSMMGFDAAADPWVRPSEIDYPTTMYGAAEPAAGAPGDEPATVGPFPIAGIDAPDAPPMPVMEEPLEGTRIMVADFPEMPEGTSSLTSSLQEGQAGVVESGKLAPSPDMPTVLMRQKGGNLRTITEYLRASANSSSGEIGSVSGPFPSGIDLNSGAATAMGGSIHITRHSQTNLSTSALVGMEQQSMAMQLVVAEAEKEMAETRWDAATDTCFDIIHLDPTYMPVHLMLADIYKAQGKTEEAADKLGAVVDTYVARQEPDSAAYVCKRLLELRPNSPTLQLRYGMLLMEAGRVEDAARALLAVPDRLYRGGKVREALEEAQKLKAQLLGSSDVALAVGTYEMALGMTEDALGELGRALQLDPGNNHALSRLYVLLAMSNDATQWDALESIMERVGKEKGTIRVFMEELHGALAIKPMPSIYYALALIANKAGLADIATDALDNGLIRFSTSPTADLDASWMLLEVLMSQFRADLAMTEKDEAIAAQHYRRALELMDMAGAVPSPEGEEAETPFELQSPRPDYSFLRMPDPAQLYYGLAEAYAAIENAEGALQALLALKKLMPDDHTVHTRLADIYFRQGKLAQALSSLNDLLVHHQKVNDHEKTLETLTSMARLAPNNIPVRRKLADMYIKLGMTEYGLSEMSTLAELQLKAGRLKDAMSTYQKSADLYYTLGQHDEALSIYERIVRLAPRDMDARQQLINMYIQTGKIPEAIDAERAMADVFIQDGQVEGAIAALHQLLALAPEDVPAHHLLAQQLISIGEYGQAARLYGRLVRIEPQNSRNSILQTEMQRMAREAGKEAGERVAAS